MLHFSSINLTIIPLFALILISGLGPMSNAFAQDYEIPDIAMGDFEMPTPEEMEKMMQQQEVSGKYMNPDHGVEVIIPNGGAVKVKSDNASGIADVIISTLEDVA